MSSITVAECGGLLTGGQGKFASPNYPEQYSNYMNCEWVIGFVLNYYSTFLMKLPCSCMFTFSVICHKLIKSNIFILEKML